MAACWWLALDAAEGFLRSLSCVMDQVLCLSQICHLFIESHPQLSSLCFLGHHLGICKQSPPMTDRLEQPLTQIRPPHIQPVRRHPDIICHAMTKLMETPIIKLTVWHQQQQQRLLSRLSSDEYAYVDTNHIIKDYQQKLLDQQRLQLDAI